MKLGLARTTSYDLPLVAVVLILLCFGLAMVYSASGITALDANEAYLLIHPDAKLAIVTQPFDQRTLAGHGVVYNVVGVGIELRTARVVGSL